MDYEKAYKAVLQTATQWIEDGCTDKERICLECVFPELCESGDEEVRKEIIEYLKLHDKGENDYAHPMFSKWFNWLEKQKEPKQECGEKGRKGPQEIGDWRGDEGVCKKQKESLHDSEICKENANSFTDGIIEVRSFQRGMEEGRRLEKQKENPKTADSIPSDCASDAKCGNSRHKVGDSLEGRKLGDEVVAYLIKSGYQPIIKDTLDQKHFQIKIPRHKEDFFQSKEYKHCREILDEYYYEGDFAGDVYTLYVLRQKEQKPLITGNDFGWIDELKHDLKHPEELDEKVQEVLKKRQKPAEWSEEDEEMIKMILGDLEWERRNTTVNKDIRLYDEKIAWLKSLRPRPSWKPSKERMRVLKQVEDRVAMKSGYWEQVLDSLYLDLQKL